MALPATVTWAERNQRAESGAVLSWLRGNIAAGLIGLEGRSSLSASATKAASATEVHRNISRRSTFFTCVGCGTLYAATANWIRNDEGESRLRRTVSKN